MAAALAWFHGLSDAVRQGIEMLGCMAVMLGLGVAISGAIVLIISRADRPVGNSDLDKLFQ